MWRSSHERVTRPRFRQGKKDGYELFGLLNLDLFDPNVREKYDDATVLRAVQSNPNAAKKKYRFTFIVKKEQVDHAVVFNLYPLFVVCSLGGSLDVVSSIYRACPRAISYKDESGRTALHWACSYRATEEVIRFLVKEYPEALRVTSNHGKSPLRIACANRTPLNVIELLVENFPPGLQARNDHGRTVLHDACSKNAPIEVIRYLLEQYPGALMVTDGRGWTPLHHAHHSGAADDVVKLIERRYPQARKMKDVNGEIPIMLTLPKNTVRKLPATLRSRPTHVRFSSDPTVSTNSFAILTEAHLEEWDRSEKPCSPPQKIASLEQDEFWDGLTYDTAQSEESISYTRELMKVAVQANNPDPFEIPVEYLEFCTDGFSHKRRCEEGSLCQVFIAKDRAIRCQFAVKRLRARALTDPRLQSALKSFLREKMAETHIWHTNIARQYAYHLSPKPDGDHYLVHEIASNGSLHSWLKSVRQREKLHWTTRISIALDIAKALEYLHSGKSGQVCFHRDVKSATVFLKNDFTAQLIHCGIPSLTVTNTGSVGAIGAPGYICPSLSRHKNYDYSSAHDVFSLGVVFAELYTGVLQNSKRVGEKMDMFDYYSKDGSKKKNLLQDFDSRAGHWDEEIRHDFACIILQCLSQHPETRPRIDSIVERLENLDSKSRPWCPGERNGIMVLSSAPLVYRDNEGELFPLPGNLNFQLEREILSQCISEARRDIRLTFDVATDDRLHAAAIKRCGCLHFSGHGHPESLLFEDGAGGAHWLAGDKLFDCVHAQPFRFVFVSACHSLFMGEALVKAGVPHVVCCKKDAMLRDDAALKFTHRFYFALGEGYTIKAAFKMGKMAVSKRYGQDDGDKFVLLPVDGAHDVPLFDARMLEWPAKVETKRFIPALPQPFIGREIDTYDLLQLVLSRQLVNLVGIKGVGCSSLASAVCHYINERKSTMLSTEAIYYLRCRRDKQAHDAMGAFIQPLHEELMNEGRTNPLRDRPVDNDFIQGSVGALCETKSLIVFDGVINTEDSCLLHFINHLFEKTNAVKLLLTSQNPLAFPPSCNDMGVLNLMPLTVESTAILFSEICPHRKVAGKKDLVEKMRTGNSTFNIKNVGSGFPEQIIQAAKTISLENYLKFFDMAEI